MNLRYGHGASNMQSLKSPSIREVPECIDKLRVLRCFLAVAKHGSTVRAAEVVHLSQPSVARAVSELENYFGVPLFSRGARGMIPNDLGAQLSERVELLLQHLSLGFTEAEAVSVRWQHSNVLPGRFSEIVSPASLKALISVAACGTEARAAQHLQISQPAVHRALAQLEQLSRVRLLQKSESGTRLTEGGEAFLRRVKLAFAEARAIESDVAAWRGKLRGRVVVGSLPLSVSMILPQAVAKVRAKYPEMEITVIDGTYEGLARQLRSADVDVIVGALRPEAPHESSQEVLLVDELGVICRPGHPCLSLGPTLRLGDLLRYPWVVPLKNTPASIVLRDSFIAEGLTPPDNALQASSGMFTRSLVAETDYLALASVGEAQKDERVDLLRIVPLKLPLTIRNIGVVIRSIGFPSPDLRALLQALREEASRLNDQSSRHGYADLE